VARAVAIGAGRGHRRSQAATGTGCGAGCVRASLRRLLERPKRALSVANPFQGRHLEVHMRLGMLVLLDAVAKELVMPAEQFQGGDPIAELDPGALALP
jgi:hypothetical protein